MELLTLLCRVSPLTAEGDMSCGGNGVDGATVVEEEARE